MPAVPSRSAPAVTNGAIELTPRRQSSNSSQGSKVVGRLHQHADLFNDNDQGLIDNPLLHLRPDEVDDLAKSFATEHRLEHLTEDLLKAGRVLRDPDVFESLSILSSEEKKALREEREQGFWKQPKELKVTIITLCVAAVVQGWNQTGSNGANLNWPTVFGLKGVEGQCTPTGPDGWKFAIVNASTYLSASLIGCWFSDPLNEMFFGRRSAICISAIFILAAVVACALTNSWEALLACRVILGLGMGCKASVVPVFASEVAPAHIRGSLVMNWQLFDALGIFLGFTANLALSSVRNNAWRWQTASSALPTIILLALVWVCPESPRFLVKQGKYRSAYEALLGLRGEPILAAKELFYVHCQRNVELRVLSTTKPNLEAQGHNGHDGHEDISDEPTSKKRWLNGRFWPTNDSSGTPYFRKLMQLFTDKRNSRATLQCTIVMFGCQQLCGVNVLALYSSTFLCTGDTQNAKKNSPLFLSWGLGLVNVLFAFPAYKLIDSKGRRWLLLVTLPFLALTMMAASLSYKFLVGTSALLPVVGLFVYLFFAFYSWGVGPVPFTMSAEIFPLENRVVGMSFAVFTNLFGAGLLALFVPAITAKVGHAGVLGIFAGLNVVAFVLVLFLVRETAGEMFGGRPGSASGRKTTMSLEELNYIFGVSTAAHATYQYRKVLPWAWRYYVRRDLDCEPNPPKAYIWAATRERERVRNEASQNAAQQREDADQHDS